MVEMQLLMDIQMAAAPFPFINTYGNLTWLVLNTGLAIFVFLEQFIKPFPLSTTWVERRRLQQEKPKPTTPPTKTSTSK